METLLLYALCTASMFYLGSRAVITSFLWSRYPAKLASFMDCSACSGTWYGALAGYVGGYRLGLSFLGLPGDSPATVAAVSLCSMAWTPMVAGLVQHAFDTLGSAVGEPEPPADSRPIDPRAYSNPIAPITPLEGRAETDTVYIDREPRIASGVITPREIPIQRIVIPPKEPSGSGPG